MSRVFVENNHRYGVYIGEQQTFHTTAHIEDLTVVDTQSELITGDDGDGLVVIGPADVTVNRALIQGNRDDGISMAFRGANLEIEDVTVRDTVGRESDQFYGGGIRVAKGATLTLERGLLEGNHYAGLWIFDEDNDGSTAQLADLTVRRTQPDDGDDAGGYGIYAGVGSEVSISRARFEENHFGGILAYGVGTSMVAEDVRITGTLPPAAADDDAAAGLIIGGGAEVEVARTVIHDNTSQGVVVYEEATQLRLEDVVVSDTRPTPDTGRYGIGMYVAQGATVAVLRGLFDTNNDSGIQAFHAVSLSLNEVLVRDTHSTGDDARFGRGLHVEGGGEITIADSQFTGNRDVSVAIFGDGTTASLDHVYIGDSLERNCVHLDENNANRCFAGRGYGLGSYSGAVVNVNDVEIDGSTSIGLQLADGGTMMGENLGIRRCAVAVNLQSLPDEYDWGSAVVETFVEDNVIDLDETSMSIPEMLPD